MQLDAVFVRGIASRWWVVALRGLAAILFGILAFLAPGLPPVVLTVWVAAFMAVDGALAVLAGHHCAAASPARRCAAGGRRPGPADCADRDGVADCWHRHGHLPRGRLGGADRGGSAVGGGRAANEVGPAADGGRCRGLGCAGHCFSLTRSPAR